MLKPAAHFVASWLLDFLLIVDMPGLRWQITASKWLGSSKIARSDLGSLWPETKQSTALSQTVMVTTNADGAVRLVFLAGGSSVSSSKRFWLDSSFCLEVLNLCVPGFNELFQWLILGQAGIPLGRISRDDGNDCLRCWSDFQILLPFMVKDEVVWDGHYLLLLVLN